MDGQRECTIEFLSPMRGCTGKAADEQASACAVAWDFRWLCAPSDRFNPLLAAASSAVCAALVRNTQRNGFRYAVDALEALGFQDVDASSFQHRNEVDDADYKHDPDLVAYAMGHATTRTAAGEEVPLAVLAIRGTSHTPEWNSNANVADGVTDGNYNVEYHEGFDAAADEAYGHFARYLVHHGMDMQRTHVLVCGHSRGGAVANIIGAFMCESGEFDPHHVHVYTLAAPPATRRKDAQEEQFAGIFNVVDPQDYVPRLPLAHWGFRRFGTTMFLPQESDRLGAAVLAQAGEEEREDASRCMPTSFGSRATELYEQFTGQKTRSAFSSIGPTARMVRDAASVSPTLSMAYLRERRGKLGRKTFAQFFRDLTDLSGSSGGRRMLDSANAARLSWGPFKQFAEYFLKNRVLSQRTTSAHCEEGYLARMLAAVQTGLDLPATSTLRQVAFTVHGSLDITVEDAAGKTIASIWKGKVEKDGLPAFHDGEIGASTVWFPLPASVRDHESALGEGSHVDHSISDLESDSNASDGPVKLDDTAVFADPCPGYAISLRDRAGRSFGVTIAVQDALGNTLSQREYGPVKIGNGHTMAWADLSQSAPFHDTAKGGNLRVTVRVDGGKRADAVGAECLTAGDWAAVHAYEGRGTTFQGWYEEGRNPAVSSPLSTQTSYVLRVPEDRALVAHFK